MKTCTKCGRKRKFYNKGVRKQSMCAVCFNHYCIERWKRKKIDAIEKLGGKCYDCKQSYHPNVYDFHHVDNDKEFDWNKLRLRAQTTIEKELKKCVLLCSNCHRIRHII